MSDTETKIEANTETKAGDVIRNETLIPTGRRGFPGFRRPETITDADLETKIARLKPGIDGEYIYYSGGPYNYRAPSLRSNSLRSLAIVRVPVPLESFLRSAARTVDGTNIGYDPKSVRDGLYLHAVAKPTVYFPLRKLPSGDFVTTRNIPIGYDYANPSKYRAYPIGTVIVPASEATEVAAITVTPTVGGEVALIEAEADRIERVKKGKGRRS